MGLFMNSAQGGMVTADNRHLDQPKETQPGYWHDERSWEECVRIGKLMADEAVRIVSDAPEQKDPTLFCLPRPCVSPSNPTRCGQSSRARP